MIDRERVIKGLKCLAQKQAITANPCKGCGYINRPNYAICVKDIASDALALLKEYQEKQEGLPPAWQDRTQEHICQRCGGIVWQEDNYCSKCGQAVKWSA